MRLARELAGWKPHHSEGGKRVHIDNIGGFESFGLAQTLSVRPLPKLDQADQRSLSTGGEIGGFRISGAREKAGTEREVWIKFKLAITSMRDPSERPQSPLAELGRGRPGCLGPIPSRRQRPCS